MLDAGKVYSVRFTSQTNVTVAFVGGLRTRRGDGATWLYGLGITFTGQTMSAHGGLVSETLRGSKSVLLQGG